jgi:hypothetical protein
VVETAGLENRKAARSRGFESRSLRQLSVKVVRHAGRRDGASVQCVLARAAVRGSEQHGEVAEWLKAQVC